MRASFVVAIANWPLARFLRRRRRAGTDLTSPEIEDESGVRLPSRRPRSSPGLARKHKTCPPLRLNQYLFRSISVLSKSLHYTSKP